MISFSWVEIQPFTSADVAPLAEANVTVHLEGGATGEPVGVAGLGMRPSLSTGRLRFASIWKSLALTGGAGWVMKSRDAGPTRVAIADAPDALGTPAPAPAQATATAATVLPKRVI
ncbi:MAG: hypothetical protein ACLQK4_05995 [Acidimicrobiales bacterium]